jgi:outer membrane lipoprotein-sorting protein
MLNFNISIASEKDAIIKKLNNTKSMEFSFIQTSNEIIEKGNCILLFPKKLKCIYMGKNKKELVINKNRLAITQKRYNKSYFYPVKKSPFVKVLNKNSLVKFIENGEIKKVDGITNIIVGDANHNKIKIFFNKNLELAGWLIKDKFNNNIDFLINITSENKEYTDKDFIIPNLN